MTTCDKCSGELIYFENNCLSECPETYYLNYFNVLINYMNSSIILTTGI